MSQSAFVLRVLEQIDARIARQVAEREAAFRANLNESDLGFQATGPYIPYEDDAALVEKFIELVRSQQPDARIFRDSEALRTGSDWISALADAIDSSRRFVAIFSPAYFDSKWCKREFNAAILRDDQGDDDLLYPIFLREDSMAPSLYLTFNHVDCREADLEKLKAASEQLVAQLGGDCPPGRLVPVPACKLR